MQDWNEILTKVIKPGQYLGNEINAVHKDLSRIKTKIALIFPDMYELGMSHLGLKILYHLLNRRENVAVERAYAPGLDLEEILRRENFPLVSLESQAPLKEFNILGFTLPYEMGYSNVLNIMDLAQIPLLAAERDERYPLIIGGGACTANPEPLADFFDLFVLGDGEEVILELVDAYQSWQNEGSNKQELLAQLARIPGIYVPSLFNINYKEDGTIAAIDPLKNGYNSVQRRVVMDMDQAYYPIECITPHLEVVHDRVTMEIARGCTQGCRFCQAGITYRPRRQRSPQVIADLAGKALAATGYEEISLASLSSGDYTQLPQLLQQFASLPEQMVSVSLPSLRPGTLAPELVEYIKKVRQTGFTIAPEAGSERLRNVINKRISVDDVFQTVNLVFSNGWQGIKLYFMLGLPTEEPADLDGIAQLTKQIDRAAKQASPHHNVNINVAVSAFVPKAHTPFQWVAQDGIAEVEAKQDYLQKQINRRHYKFKWHDPRLSYLEGTMARGDRRLGKVILQAWRNGARFDQWSEHFNFAYWQEAFTQCDVNPDFYTKRERALDEILPWQHLDMGVSQEFLKREYQRALSAQTTPDCRVSGCQNCGISEHMECPALKQEVTQPTSVTKLQTGLEYTIDKQARLRARFYKLGQSRFISHLDLIRLFSRALRRAQLPISYSQGFHPHPSISFTPPLSIGVESEAEYVDFILSKYVSPNEFAQRLNRQLPGSLQLSEVRSVALQMLSLNQQEHMAAYRIWVPAWVWTNGHPASEIRQGQEQHLADYLSQGEILITRANSKLVNAKPLISSLKLTKLDENGLSLELLLFSTAQNSIKPQEIIKNLYHMGDAALCALQIKRMRLWLKSGQHFVSPLGMG